MAILIFEHHPQDPPARLGEVLRDYGHRLRVVELHNHEPLPPDLDDVDGIISLGGPMNVDQADDHPWMGGEMALIRQAHERELPIVGLCLGAQLIAKALGGTVQPMDQPEIGWHKIKQAFPGTMDPLYGGIPWETLQFHMHGQEVTELPGGATPLAGSAACKNQAFRIGLKNYAFQYHFEWTKTEMERVLANNAEKLSAAGANAEQIRQQTEEHYRLYRHQGDRLCHNIADLLFAIDKRFGTGQRPIRSWEPW